MFSKFMISNINTSQGLKCIISNLKVILDMRIPVVLEHFNFKMMHTMKRSMFCVDKIQSKLFPIRLYSMNSKH